MKIRTKTRRVSQDPVKYEVTAYTTEEMLAGTRTTEASYIGDVDESLGEVKAEAVKMLKRKIR